MREYVNASMRPANDQKEVGPLAWRLVADSRPWSAILSGIAKISIVSPAPGISIVKL